MQHTLQQRLDHEYARLKNLETMFLGYPCDAEFNYAPLLSTFFKEAARAVHSSRTR